MKMKTVTDILLAVIIIVVSACSAPAETAASTTLAATEPVSGETAAPGTEKAASETEETTSGTTAAETTAAGIALEENGPMGERKVIALTFDDGPNTTTTGEVLDVLEKYGIVASFFLIGSNIDDESAKMIKRAYDMGCEIGNHSKSHLYMDSLSAEEIKAEVGYVTEKVTEITGEPPKFFRPPYIAVSDLMFETIDMPFIAGYGANDWDDKVDAEKRAKRVLKQAKNGAVILLHDAKGNSMTVEALDTIIPELLSQGYEFVTISEVFSALGVTPRAHDKRIYSFAEQETMYG